MTIYTYDDVITSPSLNEYDDSTPPVINGGIHYDIDNSAMTDKSFEYARWDEDDAALKISFTNSLSAGDKTILDGIVFDNS